MSLTFRDQDNEESISDINVTPLVDVMLVLLIIFMVAAPMLHQGIKVELPKSQARPLPQQFEDPLVLSLSRDGLLFIKDRPVHASRVVEQLLPLLQSKPDQMVFIKGDQEVPYGKVVELLEVLRLGGIVNVGMVTETPKPQRR